MTMNISIRSCYDTSRGIFYAAKRAMPIEQSAGQICSEFVMCYPPGIPILAPGERITQEILDYIAYAKEKRMFFNRYGRYPYRKH